MITAHFTAIALGFLLDRLIGDPPHWPHPVRWIGNYIAKMTALLNKGKYRTAKGALLLWLSVLLTVVVVSVIVYGAYQLHIVFGCIAEAVLIASGLAQKSLRDAAIDVYKPLQNGDMTEARTKLSWIVGRDTDQLDESDIVRGTIETVSENTSDGVTSPLFWAFIGGAPGLWLYKTVNTLDSMVGYKDERYEQFGKWSARADDVLNFIPARMTGLLILLCTPNEGKLKLQDRLQGFKKDARRHPSPNSGFLEAATAWQLDFTLGGTSTYKGRVSARPEIGPRKTELEASSILSAIRQMHWASVSFFLTMTVIGAAVCMLIGQ